MWDFILLVCGIAVMAVLIVAVTTHGNDRTTKQGKVIGDRIDAATLQHIGDVMALRDCQAQALKVRNLLPAQTEGNSDMANSARVTLEIDLTGDTLEEKRLSYSAALKSAGNLFKKVPVRDGVTFALRDQNENLLGEGRVAALEKEDFVVICDNAVLPPEQVFRGSLAQCRQYLGTKFHTLGEHFQSKMWRIAQWVDFQK